MQSTGVRFTRQGQSCTAASRILVHKSIVDEFVERLVAKVDAMVIGDPLDEKTDIGTIVSHGQFERVQYYLGLAADTPEATLHRCGQLPTEDKFGAGLCTACDYPRLTNEHRACREEIFGPVTAIITLILWMRH